MIDDTEIQSEWQHIVPKVNSEAEFYEILHDFGNPLELIREAISNAFDAKATWVRISFDVKPVEGNTRLVVVISDNGTGMTEEILHRDFWGLGYSQFREKADAIGEKGHGTKIYLRSESVIVRTQCSEYALESRCNKPMSDLSAKRLHKPETRTISKYQDYTGTEITIIGYNDNERSKFTQEFVTDYIQWFTKAGSIEHIFGITDNSNFKVYLKCLGRGEFQTIVFGHLFPPENQDINALFKEKGAEAADWYVKRYIWQDQQLEKHPEVTYDAVISVEGDSVKRQYNALLGERIRSGSNRYRVGDRYGIWLCKDYIPITRVNDWISGFGSGSNAFTYLHGFINCQSLRLTANRGDIANTDPGILEELKERLKEHIETVDKELRNKGLYTLREWQAESRTLAQEKTEYEQRLKVISNRKVAVLEGRQLLEPKNESELFSLLIIIHTMHPEIFEFDPCDYNTNRGIDIIAKNRDGHIHEPLYWYIELKHTLSYKRFNHAFKYLRWIVCWDFSKNLLPNQQLEGIEENDKRELKVNTENGHHTYFLDSQSKATKVQVIRMKEFLKERLGIEFKAPQ
ncbi:MULTISPECIES: ATP-binding protein [Dehalococcoides]|uniref:ATP-binding protein n=1 Tax=Dehalococcoides mccartyi TaxID=61435 RepID=A0AB38Z7Z9_9CHLR|nr:ATP-binding protein [Dehalococcoides mccartyi]OBW61718.1 MAG: hypothetical protein A9181_01635 [Dehalococcoides mccartyi]WRO06676.1 ATP-binding protein [Dehalococcoides mccartyi]